MRHPRDPRDGWPTVSTSEFIGMVIVAILGVAFVWAGAVTYLVTFGG